MNSFDVLWTTNRKLSNAGLLSAEVMLLVIQQTCSRFISSYSFFTCIYLFKLTFCAEHSTASAVAAAHGGAHANITQMQHPRRRYSGLCMAKEKKDKACN